MLGVWCWFLLLGGWLVECRVVVWCLVGCGVGDGECLVGGLGCGFC